jgi:PLP dependent protein
MSRLASFDLEIMVCSGYGLPVLEKPCKLGHKLPMNLIPHPALQNVRDRIVRAAQQAGRAAEDIKLVAVSKTFEEVDILPAVHAGQTCFGENRVQEAVGKWRALKGGISNIELHLIGPLQTNKAADAVALFDAIHTIDRPRIAQAIAAEMQKQGRKPQLFIQVNTGGEAQKAGVAVTDADAFIVECRSRHGLTIDGLMCIPPVAEKPDRHFRLLADIAKRNHLHKLSMGMSGDFETAILYGATHVRVGSAIFGTR